MDIPLESTLQVRVAYLIRLAAASISAILTINRISAQTPRHLPFEATYTITSVLQILNPIRVDDMNDDFQEARVLAETGGIYTVEVTYYPITRFPVGEDKTWLQDDAFLQAYLKPDPIVNWDQAMRRDLIKQLKSANIDPTKLTDKEVVTRVSQWAMKRARTSNLFSIWCVYLEAGKAAIYPPLRSSFQQQARLNGLTEQMVFDREILGKSLYYSKLHGTCTSSAVYLATIFRALGIPTRIVICIPPFDPNDEKQATLFYSSIHNRRVRQTVQNALAGTEGFADHILDEVYIGHHWIRLSYNRLNSPTLNSQYLGLMTHIFTCADLNEAHLASTWGMRYFHYPSGQPPLSSINPYRLISVKDHFGNNFELKDPLDRD